MSIRIAVDPTNPGQFFACCGLLELADRMWPGAEGWFEGREFFTKGGGELRQLLAAVKSIRFTEVESEEDGDDENADHEEDDGIIEPLLIESPIQLRLDWWTDKSIKTWAGSMNVHHIARAMCNAIDAEQHDPLNQSQVVFDPPQPSIAVGDKRKKRTAKKREPFYFDARRGPNAHSRDIGFSPNDLKMTTTAFPVVEFLCLIGLQRSRPTPTEKPREFHYFTWTKPINVVLLPPAVSGLLPGIRGSGYCFANRFRSGQKKLKAYYPSTLLGDDDD